MAVLLKAASRGTDLCARYGGEEFVVLCPGVTWEGAHVLAERIRSRVEAQPFLHKDTQPGGAVTVSVGVASFPHDGATWSEILKAADNALYHSKKNGRNQVSYAGVLELLSKKTA